MTLPGTADINESPGTCSEEWLYWHNDGTDPRISLVVTPDPTGAPACTRSDTYQITFTDVAGSGAPDYTIDTWPTATFQYCAVSGGCVTAYGGGTRYLIHITGTGGTASPPPDQLRITDDRLGDVTRDTSNRRFNSVVGLANKLHLKMQSGQVISSPHFESLNDGPIKYRTSPLAYDFPNGNAGLQPAGLSSDAGDYDTKDLSFYWSYAELDNVEVDAAAKSNGKYYYASALYKVEKPNSVNGSANLAPVNIGQYYLTFPNSVLISAGTQLNLPSSAGFHPTYSATAPNDFSGYFGETQLYSSTTTPAQSGDTNGSQWLDGCPVYATNPDGTAGSNRNLFVNAGQQTTYETVDAPASGQLDSSASGQHYSQTFWDWFMFRPAGSDSIWVPLVKMSWAWSGTATYSASANPPWSVPDASPNTSQTTTASEERHFPVWTQVNPAPAGACPSLP